MAHRHMLPPEASTLNSPAANNTAQASRAEVEQVVVVDTEWFVESYEWIPSASHQSQKDAQREIEMKKN